MLMVVGSINSNVKDDLIAMGDALIKEGYVIAYNAGYYSAVVMKEEVTKSSEENN